MSWLLLIPLLLGGVTANTFNPTCTHPTEITRIVSGPDVRSTWSILWSCLLTIFLCVWTVRHPSVPRPELKEDPKWKQVRDYILMNLISIIISLGAPELELGYALGDAIYAYRWSRCEVMIAAAEKNGRKWTLSHAYLMVMEGFYGATPSLDSLGATSETMQLLNDGTSNSDLIKPTISPELETSALELESQNLGGSCTFAHEDEMSSNGEKTREFISMPTDIFRYSLKAPELCFLAKRGLIADFPCITEDEIRDRSKENALMKLLPMGQIIWLIVQLSVRRAAGLRSTQLEIATLSFGVCTFITYSFYLFKPKDIQEPVRLRLTRQLSEPLKAKFHRIQRASDARANVKGVHGHYIRLWPLRQKVSVEDIGILVGGVVFGAIHCAAWDFEFPSPADQKLWRVASAVTIALLPAYFMLMAVLGESLGTIWLTLVVLAYGVFRVIILVLTFRSLLHSPPGVFVNTWTTSFPHFGS